MKEFLYLGNIAKGKAGIFLFSIPIEPLRPLLKYAMNLGFYDKPDYDLIRIMIENLNTKN